MLTPDDLFGDDDIIWYLLHERRSAAAAAAEGQDLTLSEWLELRGYDPADVSSWNVPEVLAEVPWDMLSEDQGFRPDWI